MLKRINQCDVYVGMWCIYMLQEILYPPCIFNQLLQIIMLLWGVVALFKFMIKSTEYYSPIFKATFLLIVMYTIYGTIHIMFDEPINGQYTYYYLQSALNSLAPIFLFYDFTKNGKLTSDRVKVYLPFLIVTCILLYYKTENQMLLLKDTEEVTNNAGYFFVSLIPFLFFYSKRPILQFAFLAVILLYVFMGMKRGAILIGIVGAILFLYANLKKSSGKRKFLYLTLTMIIIVGTSLYIDYMMNNSDYFINRYEETLEGKTSGRDLIYENLWNKILTETSPFYFYLGRGANSTLKIIGTVAHQDWLETFCNNGLVGVLILYFFFYIFGKTAWKSRLYFSGMMFYSFVALFIIVFCKTLFSMSIQNLDLPITMLLGYFAFELHNLEQNDIYATND